MKKHIYHVERPGISGGPTFTSWAEAVRYARHILSDKGAVSIWVEEA